MKKHFFILTVCVLIALLGWMYHIIVRDGRNVETRVLLSDGDSELFARIRVSCRISDQTHMQSTIFQELVFGGENLAILETDQQILSARQAVYLPREDTSISHHLRGNEYIYNFYSGGYLDTGSGDYMTIHRYPLDYSRSSDIVHLPVRARIPGRGYNAWEAIYSFVSSPLAEIDNMQYLIVPVDYRFTGFADILRINKWKVEKRQSRIDYQAVIAEENEIYDLVATIDLEEKTNIGGLYSHEQTLVVFGAEIDVQKNENGQEYTRGKSIFVKRFDFSGQLIDSAYHEIEFNSMQNACLEGDTLTVVTNGQNLKANAFILGDSVEYWGSANLEYDSGYRMLMNYQSLSFQVIENRLYMAAAADLVPQLHEDRYTINYIDGQEFKSGYPAWDRKAIKLAVYDQEGSVLYSGLYDVGLDQDIYYKQNPAYNPPTDTSLPERTIISLSITPETNTVQEANND